MENQSIHYLTRQVSKDELDHSKLCTKSPHNASNTEMQNDVGNHCQAKESKNQTPPLYIYEDWPTLSSLWNLIHVSKSSHLLWLHPRPPLPPSPLKHPLPPPLNLHARHPHLLWVLVASKNILTLQSGTWLSFSVNKSGGMTASSSIRRCIKNLLSTTLCNQQPFISHVNGGVTALLSTPFST